MLKESHSQSINTLEINSRAAYLRDQFQLQPQQIEEIQSYKSSLFSSNQVITKLQHLTDLGITEPISFFKKAPLTLTLNQGQIQSEIDRLHRLGIKPIPAINSNPNLLLTSNIFIKKFIIDLQQWNINGLTLLNNDASAFNLDIEEFPAHINILSKQGFSQPNLMIETCPWICRLKKHQIIKCIQDFSEKGFDKKIFETSPSWFARGIIRIDTIFQKFPHLSQEYLRQIIQSSPQLGQMKTIQETITFLEQVINLNHDSKLLSSQPPQPRLSSSS